MLLETIPNKALSLREVLFATDFSSASAAAQAFAIAISHQYGSTLHAVHVIPEQKFPAMHSAIDPVGLGAIYEEAHAYAQEKMQQMSPAFEGLDYKTHVCHGKVWDVLSDLIKSNQIDLIVTGTHGRNAIQKLVLGSVAEGIFRHASCPVLTVGPHVHIQKSNGASAGNAGDTTAKGLRFRHILFATDFTLHSLSALPYALSLAEQFKLRLTLLHVIANYDQDLHGHPGNIERAFSRLEGLLSDEERLWCEPQAVVEYGSPDERILAVARDRGVDLIVLGVRAAGPQDTLFNQTTLETAYRVITHAECPVLTVRGPSFNESLDSKG